jgi:hypothetical protein
MKVDLIFISITPDKLSPIYWYHVNPTLDEMPSRNTKEYLLIQLQNNSTRIQDAPIEQRISFGPDLQVNSTIPSAYDSSNLVQVASPHLQYLSVSVAIAFPSNETN